MYYYFRLIYNILTSFNKICGKTFLGKICQSLHSRLKYDKFILDFNILLLLIFEILLIKLENYLNPRLHFELTYLS